MSDVTLLHPLHKTVSTTLTQDDYRRLAVMAREANVLIAEIVRGIIIDAINETPAKIDGVRK